MALLFFKRLIFLHNYTDSTAARLFAVQRCTSSCRSSVSPIPYTPFGHPPRMSYSWLVGYGEQYRTSGCPVQGLGKGPPSPSGDALRAASGPASASSAGSSGSPCGSRSEEGQSAGTRRSGTSRCSRTPSVPCQGSTESAFSGACNKSFASAGPGSGKSS